MMNTERKIYFLTGIKHSGKSNVGKTAASLIARERNAVFVDTDDLIVQALPSGYSGIRDFYRREGKDAFMDLEYRSLKKYLSSVKEDLTIIIATGGGACDNTRMVSLMKESGTVLYLCLKEETLLRRIQKKGIPPFLDENDIENSFHTLFVSRDREYRHICDFVVPLEDLKSIEHNGQVLASFIVHI